MKKSTPNENIDEDEFIRGRFPSKNELQKKNKRQRGRFKGHKMDSNKPKTVVKIL